MAPHLRNGFVFKTPMGWIHLPSPRGINAPITGLVGETLRATSDSSPRFADLLTHSLEEIGPHGGPQPMATGLQVATNRGWTGRSIIPDREANQMSIAQRFRDPRMLGYQASALTGGMLDPHRLSMNPFAMDQHPHQSVTDYFDRLHALENARTASPERKLGLRFEGEREYQRLHAVEQQMKDLAMRLRGERKVGSRTVQGEKPPDETAELIRARQVKLARRALGQ